MGQRQKTISAAEAIVLASRLLSLSAVVFGRATRKDFSGGLAGELPP
jgi:hypothetical protein